MPEELPRWKCPHCEAFIDHVKYSCSVQGQEWGIAHIPEGEDYFDECECDDSSTDDTDNYEYTCPECEHLVDREEIIDTHDPEYIPDKTEEEEEQPKNEDGIPLNTITIKETLTIKIARRHNYQNIDDMVYCPTCNTLNIVEDGETYSHCTKCGKSIKRQSAFKPYI